jgi:hypothetical protein
MARLLSLFLVVLAASPALASADECMLSAVGQGEVSGISVPDPLVETFGNESVDVELELRLGLRRVPNRRDALGVGEEGGTLWCLSPDDPRCFPVDGPTEAPPLSDPMPTTAAPEMPDVGEREVRDLPSMFETLTGPPGIETRIERPPQG